MNKKGAEGAWWTIIVLLILVIVAIFVIYSFMVKHREEISVFNRLFNQTTTTEGISLKGVSEEIKKDPERYLDSVLNEDPQRYIEICENDKDPRGKLSPDDIKLLKEKDCKDIEKAQEKLTKVQLLNENKADELYRKYWLENNADALNELKTKHSNSIAKKFSDVLGGNNFDKDAETLCKESKNVISLFYCADVYKFKAEKTNDLNKKNDYNKLALKYYRDSTINYNNPLMDDREKKFFGYAHLYWAMLQRQIDNRIGLWYISLYSNVRSKLGDDIKKYMFEEDLIEFEQGVKEATINGINDRSVNTLYVDPVFNIQGRPDLDILTKGKVDRGSSSELFSVGLTGLSYGASENIELIVRPLPYSELTKVVPIVCEFHLPEGFAYYQTSFGKAILSSSNIDSCRNLELEFKFNKDQIEYRITWK